ncbi:NAD dependent epimerase/dehydratase family protein [Corynebacterium kalinowskii]|uniref:NAD dependent epimerase/dehydratase family protein n=1 Tax=Corynebacterium kalinowskii TaxID=2675216 RepID=A0A6B8VQW6_9CORY|nr:NAD-dependent epimerase/dehydratase family protein [Corynebacterium kalinowskii]QGU01156.1 NAD dependent epimerase/dehydratase family protein [Corynebacterium kalinowskii]
MKYLVTGAGQIGSQLVHDLTSQGHAVNCLRKSGKPVSGATVFSGDVADRQLLAQAVADCAAIFHCTHAPYDSRAWRELLPPAETAVMGTAVELGIPVVFPESMYAFAGCSGPVMEGATPNPIEGKGQVRAELLAARAAHEAQTVSVIAADLVGPTATSAGSVITSTVLAPAKKGLPVIVLADPDVQHSATFIPDLSATMIFAAQHADELPTAINAPSVTHTLREWAYATGKKPPVWGVPNWPIQFLGRINRMCFELAEIAPMWHSEFVLGSSSIPIEPSPWSEVVARSL